MGHWTHMRKPFTLSQTCISLHTATTSLLQCLPTGVGRLRRYPMRSMDTFRMFCHWTLSCAMWGCSSLFLLSPATLGAQSMYRYIVLISKETFQLYRSRQTR
eukprot:Rmarinus@m.3809